MNVVSIAYRARWDANNHRKRELFNDSTSSMEYNTVLPSDSRFGQGDQIY